MSPTTDITPKSAETLVVSVASLRRGRRALGREGMDVEEPKSTTRLVRCVLLLTCVSFIGCQQAAQEKTLVDLYPDHSVFRPARLSEGEIAIEDGSGTFGASVAIGQLQFSDEAHILLRSVPASPGFTVRALSEDMARGKSPLPATLVQISRCDRGRA